VSAALAAESVGVTLNGNVVLKDVNLSVPPRRWTAVVGPNGAGKTTLLKAMAQLVPHEGRVLWSGRDAARIPPRERARSLAWLGQGESGAEDLLAQDVVMLGRLPHQPWLGTPSSLDRDAVANAMRETQCDGWRTRPLGQLSAGERQRVLLARALAVRADMLLMDEPLANLDPPHQSDWLGIVRAHVARGGTAVSVLHEITLALHADELVVMNGGRVVHQGESSSASTHRALEDVFQARIAVRFVDGQWVALPR